MKSILQKIVTTVVLSMIVLFVNAQTPANPAVTGYRFVCSGSSTTLTASGVTGASFAWYDASSGGNLLASTASYATAVLTSDTHFYVAQTTGNGTSNRTDVYVLATAIPNPNVPVSVMVSPPTICQGGSANLSATVDGASGQYVFWYDAATGGNLLGSSANGANFTVSPTDTTTYYAASQIEQITTVFNYSGSVQTFTVPAGVTNINIDASGAKGGNANQYNIYGNRPGGNGGRVQSTMTVTPGDVLYLYVGGMGGADPDCDPCNPPSPGWNGGGSIGGTSAAGSGGGATDIRYGGQALTNRVLVAGGGGGAGFPYYGALGGDGGQGGGLIGGNGVLIYDPGQADNVQNGKGGTQNAGGAGGCTFGNCSGAGSFGNGGSSGNDGGNFGGAGGGGWYGGGGSISQGGGGGGSSYTDSLIFQNVIHTQGYNGNNGLLTINYKMGADCGVNYTRVPVTLNVNTTPSVGVSTNVIICPGTQVTLNATGADTYSWQPGNLTGSSIAVTPTSTTAYTVTGTLSLGGCTNTNSVTVTVENVSTIGTQTICYGFGANLGANGANSYIWQPGNLSGQNVTVYPTTTTTYTVTGTDTVGCSTTATEVVNVNPLPTVSAGSNQSIVQGNNVTLTATGANTYSWSPVTSNSASVTFTPAATGTYTVTGTTSATGCTNTSQVTVTVTPANFITGITDLCPGNTTTLTATGFPPFTWYDSATGGNLLYTGNTFVTPVLNNSMTYWLSGNGSTRSSINVEVDNPVPVNVVASPAAVCPGFTSTLTATVNGGTIQWYTDSTGNTLLGTTNNGAGISVNPTATTTYYAQGSVQAVTTTYNYTGGVQTFTVPAGVTNIKVNANAGRGGNAYENGAYGGKSGGNGGNVQATMNVTPGGVLYFYVGGRGYGDPACSPCSPPTPGWNGGGAVNYDGASGSGGGATDIRVNGQNLTNRILVAGGGGGGGYPQYGAQGGNGGNGGGFSGQNGVLINNPGQADNVQNGKGGTQSTGGAGGCIYGNCAQSGSFGNGGNSGNDGGEFGGAGGGGWYGGGGSTGGGGGGGGSSYINPLLLQNIINTQGVCNTNGSLTISYFSNCSSTQRTSVTVTVIPNPTITASASSNPICIGTTITLAASGGTSYSWLSPPLDQVSTAKLATGLRKLSSSYSGYALQLRRASDNAIMNFGFVGEDLDTASINAFLGASQGYCSILYDQSGNGNNILQNNTSNQPLFVENAMNGKPVLRFTASPGTWMTSGTNFPSPFTVIYTARQNGPDRARMLSAPNNNWLMGWHGGNKQKAYYNGWVSNSSGTPATDNNVYTYSGTSTGNISTLYENGNLLFNDNGGTTGPNGVQINGYSNGGNELSDGDFTDVFVFNSVLSNANRQIIENSLNTYYVTGVPTTSSISVNPSSNTNYFVIGTANGCSSSATLNITVNPLPTVTASASSSVTCAGSPTTLTSTGANTYSWSPDISLSTTTGSSVIASPTSTTSYTVSGTDNNGCINTAAQSITVNPLPSLTVSSSNQTICSGGSVDITATVPSSSGINDVSFNGSNNYINIPNPYTAFTNQMTVECWVYTPNGSNPVGSGMGQATANTDNMATNVWIIQTEPNNSYSWQVNDSVAGWRSVNTGTLTTGWHHIAGTINSSGNSLYVDGVLKGTSTGITSKIKYNSSAVLQLGKDARYSSGRFWNGQFDELKVWNTSRTQAQIQAGMNTTIPNNSSGLVEYYHFDEGTGTTTADATGNGRTGTLINGVSWQASTAPTNTPYPLVWSPSSGLNTSTGTTVTATPAASTVYTATCTNPSTQCTSTSNLSITVNTPPVISCPSNIVVNTTIGQCNTIVNYNLLSVTGSPSPVITYSQNSGTAFSVGTTTVSVSATNSCGTSTCSFTVTVIDNELPVITCPATSNSVSDNGICTSSATIGTATATDNCSVASIIPSPSSPYPVGTTSVTWTATDIHGNTSSCSQTVIVTDNQNPTIAAPVDITVNNDPGNCSATVNLSTPATNDNCGVLSVINDHSSSTYPFGTTTLTWTVTDVNGNTSTAIQHVTVNDNEGPVISMPSNITVSNDTGLCSAVVNYSVTATDNCGVQSLITNPASGYTFPIGTTTVTNTATDIHGNVSTASFTVTVLGLTYTISSPTVNGGTNVLCYGNTNATINLTINSGTGPFTYLWSNGATVQNLSNLGAATYSVTVTNGCTVSHSLQVTQPAPVTFTTVVTNNSSCTTAHTASIAVTASGGTGAKTYSDNGGTSYQGATLFGTLANGTYSMKVKDANGCLSSTSTEVIASNAGVTFTTAIVNATGCSTANGKITVAASGGSGFYNYSKNGGTTYQSSSIFSSMLPGTYSMKVKDASGCMANEANSTVGPNCNTRIDDNTVPTNSSSFKVYPNPATDAATIVFSSNDEREYSIRLMDISGRIIQSMNYIPVIGENQYQLNLSSVAKGVYTVILQNGTTLLQSKIVVQ